MRNPLEPGNRRSNWLEKEKESDTSWYECGIQMFIDSMKKQLEVMRQSHLPKDRKTGIMLEYMLNQKDPAEFLNKELLRELKEAPVMLLNLNDNGFEEYPSDLSDLSNMDFDEDHKYDPFGADAKSASYEDRCAKDPFWGPMQEYSAFGNIV